MDPARHVEALRVKDHEPVQIIGPGVYPALEETFFRQLLESRAPHFRAPVGRVYWRMLVRFEKRLASRFGNDRVWLAGDAAHLTAPMGIQSMNVGMREARDLAAAMARAAGGDSCAARLQQYGEERQREWRLLLALDDAVEATAGAVPEIAALGSRIVSCLPASGRVLFELAERLGMHIRG